MSDTTTTPQGTSIPGKKKKGKTSSTPIPFKPAASSQLFESDDEDNATIPEPAAAKPSGEFHFDSENEDDAEVEDDEYYKSLSNSYLQRKFDIDYQIYVERKQLREDELSTLYGILISLVPTDSKARLRSHEENSKVKSTRNGFQLWIIIWETFQVSSSYLSPHTTDG
jgi:hypothetical protein